MVDANPVRGRAFSDAGGEERARNMGLWLRAAVYGDDAAIRYCNEKNIVLKAQVEGINTAGGFLVPDELEREILTLRDLAGIYRKNARSLPIGSDVRGWPRRVSGTTASFTAEGAATSASSAVFDEIRFVAKKISGLVQLSSEIYEDEIIGLAAFLAEELAFSFADQEDAAAFAGDGTSTYGGMRGMTAIAIDGSHNAGKYTAANGHNTFATLDGTDIAGFVGLVPNYAIANAAFYMSHAAFSNTFFRLAQSSGALTSSVLNGETVWYYLGIPIRLTPKLPTSTASLTTKALMFCGDLRLAGAIATRRGVTIRRSEDRYLDSDQIAIFGTERVDAITHSMGDNTTPGPLVALVAP